MLKTDAGPDLDCVTEDVFIFNNLIDNIGPDFKGTISVFGGYIREFTLVLSLLIAVTGGLDWAETSGGYNSSEIVMNVMRNSVSERFGNALPEGFPSSS